MCGLRRLWIINLEGLNWAVLAVSNAYGYYCTGMDIGRVEVVVTADRSIKIIDKYNHED